MTGASELVKKIWPDRQVFQGSARAYARYASKPQYKWKYLERPLWEHLFRSIPCTSLLDIGAGSGKVIGVANQRSPDGRKIIIQRMCYAHEPNPILAAELHTRFPEVRVRRALPAHLERTRWLDGFPVISANMVVNHMDTRMFERMLPRIFHLLGTDGIFSFTVPDPVRKQERHKPSEPGLDQFTVDEPAPWGGVTRYHHRSVNYYEELFYRFGVCFGFIQYGYEDSMPEEEIIGREQLFHTSFRGARRLMVIVKPDSLVPEEVLDVPTIRNKRSNRYRLHPIDWFMDKVPVP